MSSATTYAESAGSCRAPSRLQSPSPPPAAATPRAAVRRQLHFASGHGGDLTDDEDDFLFRAAEETERSHHEAKRRAFVSPLPSRAPAFLERKCICGRGACNVEQRGCGRWAYVCPATPQCKYFAWCEEADLEPNPQPAFISHTKPNNHHIFNSSCNPDVSNSPRDHLDTAIISNSQPTLRTHPRLSYPHIFNEPSNPHASNSPNNPHVSNSPSNYRAGVETPLIVSPRDHLATATTPNSQPALRTHPRLSYPYLFNGPSNPHAFNSPNNPHVSNSPNNAHVSNSPSNHRAGAKTPLIVSPQGARSNDKRPICQCRAGECIEKTIKGEKYYVCCIPKGNGACPYRVLVNAFVQESPQTGNNNPVEDNHVDFIPVGVEGNNENGPNNPDQPEYDEWPFEIVDNDVVPSGFLVTAQPTPREGVVAPKSPSAQQQPYAMIELKTPTRSPMAYAMIELKTPTRSPMLPVLGRGSPFTPGSKSNCCFRCGEDGHWSKNCPKPASGPLNSPCFRCGKVGHWKDSCPMLKDTRGY
ncbi:hypothetical protein ABZP36_009195 [Zizania latifolia]